MSTTLTVRALSAGYPSRRVLADLTMEPIGSGQVTALVGPNGAGKSTLMRALAGLLPASGSIRLDDHELVGMPLADRARHVTFMPQTLPQRVALTVLESVLAALRASPLGVQGSGGPGVQESTDAERAMDVLARVGIASLALEPLDHLSGGQRQLAGLAQALARNPRVLLLDEPTSALDLRHQVVVMNLVRALAEEGRIVIMVVHDLSLAARWAGQVIVLYGGQVAAAGSAATAITPDVLRRVYGVNSRVETCSRGHLQVLVDGLVD